MSATTRERLLDVAEERFARAGIASVTTREIVEAAGQRNTSAVSYHFGSRDGLLIAILVRRGGPIDAERGRLRAALSTPTMPDLLRCLVEPYAGGLDDAANRSYLRIVAQLRGRFAAWRIESDAETTEHLASIVDEIDTLIDAPEPVRHERIVAMIMLMTSAVAERARTLDNGVEPALDHAAFVDNLVAMLAGLLSA